MMQSSASLDSPLSSPSITESVEVVTCDKRTLDSKQIALKAGQSGLPPAGEEYDSTSVLSGEEDPANARNWSKFKRIYHTLIPATCSFACSVAISAYTPGFESVRKAFNVSNEVAVLPFTVYVLGLAFGPLIAGPLSETFGRRPVYQVSMPLFCLFTMGSGFSQRFWTLIILRFFAGLFASPSFNLGSAVIADIWLPADRAIPMTAYVGTIFMGPSLGPLLGGFAVTGRSWRWTAWVTLFVAVICVAPVVFMRETYQKTVFQNRTCREREVRDETKLKRPPGRITRQWFRQKLSRPFYMLVTEPIAGLLALYVAFNFGMQFLFFAAFPAVFAKSYHFDQVQIGLTFLGLGIGVLLGCIVLLVFTTTFYRPWVIKLKTTHAKAVHLALEAGAEVPKTTSVPPPEWRLILAFPASIVLPAALFFFAWTAGRTHWIFPVLAESLLGMGQWLGFMSAMLYITDCYGPQYSASAIAAMTFLRYILGATFPLFALQMYQKLDTHWATSLLAFINCVFAPVPWCFWRWGPILRQKTRFRQGE